MNARAIAAALLFAMIVAYLGCMDDHGPATPFWAEQEYPGTRVLYGVCYYHSQAGDWIADTIYFDYGIPDTLPYNSRLDVYYCGFVNEWDYIFYEHPGMEVRYQLRYRREGTPAMGGPGGIFEIPWNPLDGPMDSRCYTNLEETTIRTGTYDYVFMVRSIDDEENVDTTPDSIRYVGNFPPAIDEMLIGYDAAAANPNLTVFTPILGDTFYIGLQAFMVRPDTASAYQVTFDADKNEYTYRYKILLQGHGHDDDRDPPRSGIKAWLYSMQGTEEYDFGGENEWITDNPVNEYEQALYFQVEVPFDTVSPGPDFSILDNPPGFLGEQELTVIGVDMHPDDIFLENARLIPPRYDPEHPCSLIAPGHWNTLMRKPFPYARYDRYVRNIYLKLVR